MLLCIYTRVSVNEEFFENGDGEMSVYENSRQRVNGLSQSQQIPAAPSRTPVQAEVARLFAPYNVNGGARRNMTRRPAQVQVSRRSYTHTVCCLADHKADKVPSILLKADLLTSGLGEQKVTFSGNNNDPMVITNKLMEVFPKLQEGGGFEFLKIVGSTRSRNLALLQCPSTGYTLAYLKDPSTMIGQATVDIRPLQQDLHLDCVIGRTMRQIKQLRKGLKDVMVWPLLTSRPDVVPLLFPKMAEMQFTPQMLLEKITWPCEDSDDEDFDIESTCLISSFLRMFIETASSGTLAQLLTFWVGWEMLPPELKVEISGGTLPTSSTCFETLKLPAHFKTYMDFEKALVSAINSAQNGFGLV